MIWGIRSALHISLFRCHRIVLFFMFSKDVTNSKNIDNHFFDLKKFFKNDRKKIRKSYKWHRTFNRYLQINKSFVFLFFINTLRRLAFQTDYSLMSVECCDPKDCWLLLEATLRTAFRPSLGSRYAFGTQPSEPLSDRTKLKLKFCRSTQNHNYCQRGHTYSSTWHTTSRHCRISVTLIYHLLWEILRFDQKHSNQLELQIYHSKTRGEGGGEINQLV